MPTPNKDATPGPKILEYAEKICYARRQNKPVPECCEYAGITQDYFYKLQSRYPLVKDMWEAANAYRKGVIHKDYSHLPFDAEFRDRYFGLSTPMHMQLMIDAINGVEAGGKLGILMPPNHGKALALDTHIPTPTGWMWMGDIEVGDMVFDERGEPTPVVAVSEIWDDEPCSKVTFSDGSFIVCSDNHLWFTRTRKPQGQSGVRTTAEIRDSVEARGRPNHGVPVQNGLRLPEADLPIDPYTLGAWLGDGTSSAAVITTADHDILDEIEAAGYEIRKRKHPLTFGIGGLQRQLRSEGLLNEKHIPPLYLRGSEKQRLALLQGLMDTDGSINIDGQAFFHSTRKVLIDGAEELIRSLGFKCRVYEQRAKLYGKDHGPKWCVSFYPTTDRPVFKLQRKFIRQHATSNDRNHWQTIKSVESVPSVPTKCIEVASPSHLYLAGRNFTVTHNSSMMEDFICHTIATNPNIRIIIVSKSQKHGVKMLGKVKRRMTDYVAYGDFIHTFGPFKEDDSRSGRPWKEQWITVAKQNSGERDFTVEALGIAGTIYGARADLIVFDDIADLNNQTPQQIEDQLEWLRVEAMSRLEPGIGRAIFVGTRLREDDIYGRMEEEGFLKNWVKMPAIIREPGTNGPDDEGQALWPERLPMSTLLEMREEKGPRLWELVYQQNPLPTQGTTFPIDAIESCYDDSLFAQTVPRNCKVVVGVDPSVENYTAGVVFAVDPRTHLRYLVDVWNEKGLTGDGGDTHAGLVQFIVELCKRYNASKLCLESNSTFKLLSSSLTLRKQLNDLNVHLMTYRSGGYGEAEDLAVAQLSSLFTTNMLVIPHKGWSKGVFKEFVQQFVRWRPGNKKLIKDIVKATQMAEVAARDYLAGNDHMTVESSYQLPAYLQRQYGEVLLDA